jgi:hypothetical protein
MGTEDRYFLKVGSAPERGPMSRDELIGDLVPALTPRNALVRVESSDLPPDRGYRAPASALAPPDAALLSAVEDRVALTQQSTSQEKATNEKLERQYTGERLRYGS